jgi:hypothetical protein
MSADIIPFVLRAERDRAPQPAAVQPFRSLPHPDDLVMDHADAPSIEDSTRHCERSEAIHLFPNETGLLRFARNDNPE